MDYIIKNITIRHQIQDAIHLQSITLQKPSKIWIEIAQAVLFGLWGGMMGVIFNYALTKLINQYLTRAACIGTPMMTYHAGDAVIGFLAGLVTMIVLGYLPGRSFSNIDGTEFYNETYGTKSSIKSR